LSGSWLCAGAPDSWPADCGMQDTAYMNHPRAMNITHDPVTHRHPVCNK
jgi:hypothetical protein